MIIEILWKKNNVCKLWDREVNANILLFPLYSREKDFKTTSKTKDIWSIYNMLF